ncbi:hypothetical protein LOK46_29715 [Methylobacterium sp. NMS14P]|uniref:reverse transcriptase domain-containing protein n=1 Tax=Methylobacterium sp. NMS14P TaxID=2894310 RepID=UPI0023584D82|nr:reverse transcriptase domain-containing protein [Methylobacterium sp. NMS14P]WCS25245.1 hypothetical protein LOK46_29715 [Methylobacterium sp. NMS14P]
MLGKDLSGPSSPLVQPVSLAKSPVTPVVRIQTPSQRKRGKAAKRHERKLREQITRLEAEGKHRQAKRLGRMYCKSFDAKLVAASDANRRLPAGQRAKRAELHEIAADMDLRQTQGTATFRAEPKKKGYRPVVNFDLRGRTAQLVLKRAAKPFIKIRPDQYASDGGQPAACHRIVELAAQGYAWFEEIDVRSFYASINSEGVTELLGDLPKGMTEANALSSRVRASFMKTKRDIPHNDLCKLRNEVRAGIPQGSALSPLVAEAVMSNVLDQATQGADWPDVQLVVFADNIAVLGRTKADVEDAAENLAGAFSGSQLGPFNLHRKPARSIKLGFDFLSTRFIARNRRIRAEVAPAARLKRLHWISTKLKGSTSAKEIRRRMRSWGAAMGLSKGGRPLTKAVQWANSVLSYALVHKLRGRTLLAQANYHHRALHKPGLIHAHG